MRNRRISRRRFMSVSSLGIAVLCAGSQTAFVEAITGGRTMGGGLSGGDGVVDPPVGGAFGDPPPIRNQSLAPGIVEVNLEARMASVQVNGVRANLMTYNGCYPAPTIRVRRGDRLVVNLANALPATTATNLLGYRRNVTNLHTHGWHVSPEAPSDCVMYQLEPGSSYRHEYDTSLQGAGTLNLYLPHKHGLAAEQYWAGLAGALVVEDEDDVLKPFETHIMVIKDITLSGSQPAPHATLMDYMHGKEGDLVMVNGAVNPRLYLQGGQVQRWRIVNASSARCYRLALDNHTLYLIGTDGGLLDKPYPVFEILLSPGERVDLLVKGTRGATSGSYRFRSLPYARMGMTTSETRTLMTVTYRGALFPPQSVPLSINPAATRLDPDTLPVAARRTLTLGMGQGIAFINGRDFDLNPCMVVSEAGSYEIWDIENRSGMDHPFHQHVNAAQVLAISGGDPGYAALYTGAPAWKDTVLVPRMGSVTLLVPVLDFRGTAMFHCHVPEHRDLGMTGIWQLR